MALLDVSDTLIGLTELITIEVAIPGDYINGSWVPGIPTIDSSSAVVQPASNRDLNDLRLEGDTTSSYKKFYSVYPFKTANSDLKTEADIIVYKGERFKVLTSADWDSMGGYTKAITVRLTT